MLFLINFCYFVLLISSILVIVSSNSLHSVLFLIISFLSTSMLLFIFENEFLALFFLIIYLGAIAVLFLFVIMMLDINKEYSSQTKRFYFPIGILIGSVLLIEILGVVNKTFFVLNLTEVQQNYTNGYLNWYNTVDSCLDINVLGQIFYTHYVIQLLIAGLILYITVIGISFLTIQSLFYNRKKNQAIFKQISRKNIL